MGQYQAEPKRGFQYKRTTPRVVPQGDAALCWAAALESRLAVNVIENGERDGVWEGADADLKYLLFGNSQEIFLAHYISKLPDFDQFLSVKVTGHNFTDAELSKGIEITIPGKPNQASELKKRSKLPD